jgi:hypothetical protein
VLEEKISEEKKVVAPALAGFYEASYGKDKHRKDYE